MRCIIGALSTSTNPGFSGESSLRSMSPLDGEFHKVKFKI